MANIQTLLAKIMSAIYGEEVRGSIHDAIEAINDEVTEWTGLQDGTVTTQKMANSAVTTAKIADGSVTRAKLNADVVDTTLAVSGAPADAKKVGDEVSDLKTAITTGSETTLNGFLAESWTSAGGINIYKSDVITIPAGAVVENIKYKPNVTGSSGYIYILDENNKILYKYSGSSASLDWETVTINQKFNVNAHIAVSGLSIKNTYSTSEQTTLYSHGLYEASSADNSKDVGETLTFTQNVPTRNYSFAVSVKYKVEGLGEQINDLDESETTEAVINPSDFVMPIVVKKEGNYTLIGKWFDHQLDSDRFKNCCNCGGQSIMMKVKNATTINASFGQVSRYPDNPQFLMANEPYIAYSIDGSSFTRVQVDSENGNTITMPDTNEHFVWIVIDGMDMTTVNGVSRDTGWCGVYVKSITTDGTLYAVEPKNKQILFVGNSMIEGINTLGTTSKSPSNSAVNEFSFKTAQKLNAIPLLNGYGGTTTWTGVNWVRYSFGTTDTAITTMEPDLIVIEYGHNDNTLIVNQTHTVAEFIAEYENLISILRGMYTGCPIICIVPFKQYLKDAIQTVVANTDCCYLIETADYAVTYSDGTHPDASGATAIAERLSADIIKIIGKQYFIS